MNNERLKKEFFLLVLTGQIRGEILFFLCNCDVLNNKITLPKSGQKWAKQGLKVGRKWRKVGSKNKNCPFLVSKSGRKSKVLLILRLSEL